ncbi:MAG TPA: glucose 1-dehydrogenase [bacterium]|nr:glucose 1-dehydrogenase [bacterium]
MTSAALQSATPNFDLHGKTALVAGAGRGIGLASAWALAGAGARVILLARNGDEVRQAAEAIVAEGGSAEWAALDVADRAGLTALLADRGPVDVLLNNAGTNRPAPFLQVTEEDFDAIVNLNVRAAFFCAQAAAQTMVTQGRGGSIINVSSQMGLVGAINRTVYCASKHALEGMTKAMALDLAPHGIRVNTLCPTFTETPLTRPYFEDPAFREQTLAQIPLGRLGQVADLTGAVVYLASDASRLMTGTHMVVDGGWTAK